MQIALICQGKKINVFNNFHQTNDSSMGIDSCAVREMENHIEL